MPVAAVIPEMVTGRSAVSSKELSGIIIRVCVLALPISMHTTRQHTIKVGNLISRSR